MIIAKLMYLFENLEQFQWWLYVFYHISIDYDYIMED